MESAKAEVATGDKALERLHAKSAVKLMMYPTPSETDAEPATAIGALLARGEAVGLHSLDHVIRRHIDEVLAHCGGNKNQAARLLEISRNTLHRYLEPRAT